VLLNGLDQGDFRKVFDVTLVYQREVEKIKAANPQVMWPRLIGEYYEVKRSGFVQPTPTGGGVIGSLLSSIAAFAEGVSGSPEDPARAPLRALMRPRPRWKILETRKLQPERDDWSGAVRTFSVVYVQLNYRDGEAAPLFKEGVLKEAILGIRIENQSGLFWSAQVVPKSELYWPNTPLRILSVQWQTTLAGFGVFDTIVSYNLLGGAPPFRSATRCGTTDLEVIKGAGVRTPEGASVYGSPLEDPKSHISITIRVDFKRLRVPFPLNCTATVTDSKGAQDTVSFAVPRPYTETWEAFCWIREPWYGWGQGRPIARGGCREVVELTAAKQLTLPKPGPQPNPAPSTAGFYPPSGDGSAHPSFGWLGNNPSFTNNPIHLGVDLPKGYREPVYSIADGKVVLVRADVGKYGGLEQPGGGMFVEYRTQTEQTFYALYAHVENMRPEGSCVSAGEQLATAGHYYYDQGGKDDRPHLHFAVFFGDQLPTGGGWPWRQYVSSPSEAPGWQDPLFVLRNMKPGRPSCDAAPDPSLRVQMDQSQQMVSQPQPKANELGVSVLPTPPRQSEALRFRVRHRHMGSDARGKVSFVPSYCEGELRVTPDGDIEYVCERADRVRSRCERGTFPPIKEVRLRDDGGLRIVLMQGGNWDFYAAMGDIRAAYDAISALVNKGKK
jgi:murein DD-endopeptidase MepM/ murein hydrolase activator NlpD